MNNENGGSSDTEASGRVAFQVLNVADLKDRLMDDVDLINEVLITFFADFKRRLSELNESALCGDLARASKAVHSIKGASGNVSAEVLMNTALQVELAAKSGDLATVNASIDKIESDFNDFRKAVLKAGFKA
ncbi:MAG: Hpt domain-containing protein [Candidatus Riflebacteria bacterium]|nr:Hpt domain-containing protein [Candidatus Riflebacteria bacterium]